MDREQVVKELIDPQAIRQRFSELLQHYTTLHKTQIEASLDGESPAYSEYLSTIRTLFGDNPHPQQVLHFQFHLMQVFLQMLTENNKKILSLILADYPE